MGKEAGLGFLLSMSVFAVAACIKWQQVVTSIGI